MIDPLGLKGHEICYNVLTGICENCFEVEVIGRYSGSNHLYLYVSNNPIKYIDINGLSAKTPEDVKDLYKKYKQLQKVIKECEGLFDDKGGLKKDCDTGQCLRCTQKICESYGPVGSPGFGGCIIPLQKACSVCNNCY